MKQSHRRVIVLASLVSVLTLTSALLLALAPAPMSPGASNTLFAIDEPKNLDVIFQPDVPMSTGRWKSIYVHQSATTAGNALSLAQAGGGVPDHFVIGNGDGSVDGGLEVCPRWTTQSSALAPAGHSIDPDCISICLVGDFDRSVPTPTQLRRVEQLIGALQVRLRIPATNVLMLNEENTPAGSGRYFPQTALRDQLLP
ncbi:MAG: N-acetylmuramoyl-L-alanine amidase [Phycisphaerae bacterium]|nr:N-acetylmuramoyl-L-alanine amidase [Phycisphaerae bacterium]